MAIVPTTGLEYWRGARFDPRTVRIVTEWNRLCQADGFDLFPSQGSYSPGYGPSAGTHDGGGVGDMGASLFSDAQRQRGVYLGRKVGLIAWLRTPAQGFAWHYHFIAAGDATPDLATATRAQRVSYYAGKNGLANGGPDDGPRDFVNVTWETYTGTSAYRPPFDFDPIDPVEDDMFTDDDANRLKNIEKALQFPGGGGASWSQALANQLEANRKSILAAVAEVKGIAQNVERQGQTGAGYDYNPAIVNQLNSVLAKLDALAAKVG